MGALDFLQQLKQQPKQELTVAKTKTVEKIPLPVVANSQSLQKIETEFQLSKFQKLPAAYRAKAMERLNYVELVKSTKK